MASWPHWRSTHAYRKIVAAASLSVLDLDFERNLTTLSRILQLAPQKQVLACFVAFDQSRLQIARLRPNIFGLGAWSAGDASGEAPRAERHIARFTAMKSSDLNNGASTVPRCHLEALEVVCLPYHLFITANGRPCRDIPQPAYRLDCNSGKAFKTPVRCHAAVERPPRPCSSRRCPGRSQRGSFA